MLDWHRSGLPIDDYLAGRRLDEPDQAAHQGGFSDTGKTHDNESLTPAHVEADVLQGHYAV